jgi:uncharacterized protein (TIGR02001 family)
MMKTVSKSLVLGSVLAASMVSSAAMAGSLTGNIGLTSDYIFRGIDQGSGATASGGVDYDFGNGLAVGTWLADVTAGIEYDLYGSYSGEASGFSYSVGFTTYRYTNDLFDSTYNEVNLGAGFGPISIEYSFGTNKKNDPALWVLAGIDKPETDYSFAAITYEQGGFSATYGSFGKDADGSYIELAYGMEVGGFDTGVSLISADKDISGMTDGDGKASDDISMVFNLGKSFDL